MSKTTHHFMWPLWVAKKKCHCKTDIRGHLNRSLLHQACQGGSNSLVRQLIQKYNADVSARDDTNSTPLHIAALCGKESVVFTLVKEFCCDTRVKGNCGRSLLHYACIGGNVNIVKKLTKLTLMIKIPTATRHFMKRHFMGRKKWSLL